MRYLLAAAIIFAALFGCSDLEPLPGEIRAEHTNPGNSSHHPDRGDPDPDECPPCDCGDTGPWLTGYGDGDIDDDARGPTVTGP